MVFYQTMHDAIWTCILLLAAFTFPLWESLYKLIWVLCAVGAFGSLLWEYNKPRFEKQTNFTDTDRLEDSLDSLDQSIQMSLLESHED